MPDFIPPADDQFHTWADDLVTYLTGNSEAPPLDPTTKTSLAAAFAAWSTPYDAHLTAQRDALTKAQAKDDARATFTILLRKVVGDVQRADSTTDTQRVAMKITVPKDGRTPVGEIESHPLITKIDTSTRLRHRLSFADSETPGSSAKPAGAKFCEIRLALLANGTPNTPLATDPETLESLALESRSPHRNDFDPGDEGKTAVYAARWINTRGEPGPWSPLATAIVPG